MKRKKLYYLFVLLLLLAVLLAALFISGSQGRWFGSGAKDALARVKRVEGDVSILRNGMAYVLQEGVALRRDDSLVTGEDSGCDALFTDGSLASLDKYSEVELQRLSGEDTVVEVREGAAIFEIADAAHLGIVADELRIEAGAGALLTVEAYHGTATASIFCGAPVLRFAEREYMLAPGDRVVLVRDDDAAELFFNRILSSDLREFLILRLIEKGGVLFEPEQLEAVLEARRSETAQLALPNDGEGLSCTLEIRCDTVLEHLDLLSPEKAAQIPRDGVILPPTQATFSKGDSVYDVLRRTCLSNGIEIEYNYAVKYTGYYVNHLAGLTEYECGPQSGWMYKVNGWFPNYGSAKYYVNDGDVVVWLYTCEGLGADLGVETWQDAAERGRS